MAKAPRWATELRDGLKAEIEAIETGQRKVFETKDGVIIDASAQALRQLKQRLMQVGTLIASFEES